MPRRVPQPTVAAVLAPAPPSPLVQRLRQDWRWAGISQFIWTFSEAFALSDWDIEALENDLDGTEQALLPDIIAKMLYALTWNRQITRDTAFEHLHKQWLKRDPHRNPFGTLEEPVEWATLGLSQKVEVLWQLCEWQMAEPSRLRSLLKSEEDPTSWRVDPVGWDRHGNTFYLFDDNRLWVQRTLPMPPRPPKKSSLKAKRAERAMKRSKPPAKRSHKRQDAAPRATTPPVPVDEPVSGTRRRTQVQFYGSVTPTVQALKRGQVNEASPKSDRATRSAARSVTQQLQSDTSSRPPPLPRGTRVSRRLRNVDDEWQQIPDEWLKPSEAKGTPRETDEESDLSELTDEEEHEAELKATLPALELSPPLTDSERTAPDVEPLSEERVIKNEWREPSFTDSKAIAQDAAGNDTDVPNEEEADEGNTSNNPELDEVKLAAQEESKLPEGFVEWEAVCVTLYDWKHFPDQFSKSRDPDEKALYKLLINDIAPQIIDVLTVKEQERLKQEAINNRKRSSRIATRELQREEEIRREQAEREMEERMERLRQEQVVKEREEAEALAREQAREARLREREERIAARQAATIARAEAEQQEKDRAERRRERRKRRREGEVVDTSSDDEGNSVRSMTRQQTPVRSGPSPVIDSSNGQSWELRCEVCKLQGWNLSDDADVVCCDDCGRWQHVKCHDRQDIAAGKGLRDWDKVDFKVCEQRDVKRQRVNGPSVPHDPLASELLSASTSSAVPNGSMGSDPHPSLTSTSQAAGNRPVMAESTSVIGLPQQVPPLALSAPVPSQELHFQQGVGPVAPYSQPTVDAVSRQQIPPGPQALPSLDLHANTSQRLVTSQPQQSLPAENDSAQGISHHTVGSDNSTQWHRPLPPHPQSQPQLLHQSDNMSRPPHSSQSNGCSTVTNTPPVGLQSVVETGSHRDVGSNIRGPEHSSHNASVQPRAKMNNAPAAESSQHVVTASQTQIER